MKTITILGLSMMLGLMVSTSCAAELTLSTDSTYVSGSRAYIELPSLVNDSVAIIVATPLGSTAALNPHPIGAYYNQIAAGKYEWSIINLDGAVMSKGLTFKVQYFLLPGPNQFVHLVTNQNTPTANASYIDNPALNNNPNAQVKIFVNWNPSVRPIGYNHYETAVAYDSAVGKWKIANFGNQSLENPSAFNVVISDGSPTITNPNSGKTININPQNPVSTSSPGGNCNCVIPTSLPPNGNAGGDLSGTYPNPLVQKLQGNPVSNDHPPAVGQVLKWNGSAWEPAADNVATTATTTPSMPVQAFFKQGMQTTPEFSNAEFPMLELSHIIVLTKRSRLIISATVTIEGYDAFFMLYIKDSSYHFLTKIRAPGGNTATICNFMIDENPGTYTLEFRVNTAANSLSGLNTKATANYSSVMVIPL